MTIAVLLLVLYCIVLSLLFVLAFHRASCSRMDRIMAQEELRRIKAELKTLHNWLNDRDDTGGSDAQS
ncbi:MAG: hypothetical protein GX294_00075 [Candidatus Cloacimonetes bacterium]|nr:hypothetical protein [Candidatus Cloacimonadota bacterium]